MIAAVYRAGGLRLSLFGIVARFGKPEDETLDDLRIELHILADTHTARTLERLAAAQG